MNNALEELQAMVEKNNSTSSNKSTSSVEIKFTSVKVTPLPDQLYNASTVVTFEITKDGITESGEVTYTGEIGAIDPWTFIPITPHTFKVVSHSVNCPALNNWVKIDGKSWDFDYLLDEMRKNPNNYIGKQATINCYSPIKDEDSITKEADIPSWCNAKIIFRAYHRQHDAYSGSYFSIVYFDLIRNDGHIHHCKLGLQLSSFGDINNHAGIIETAEDQDNTYLIDDLPDLFDPKFKIYNPENGKVEQWKNDTLERIVSSVDSNKTSRLHNRHGISKYEPLKLTEKDCNLTYYCEIYQKETNHPRRNATVDYMEAYNQAISKQDIDFDSVLKINN